jgi:phage tail-like protein
MSDENTMSSYLRYLPPVLWAGDSPLLGQLLRIFEKILTGIDDDLVLQHDDHTHQAIEEVIARLDQLFDPWRTPPQFLDWLASSVDLTFPTIWNPQQQQAVQVWDEYLRRKAIAQIVQIYHTRGLKEGLNKYLDLYTLADKRPRIAVDDGSRILFTAPQPDRFAQVATLVSQGPYPNADSTLNLDGLVSPSCIALAPDGSLLVGDNGTPLSWSTRITSGIWRVFPTGQYMSDATSGKPQRLCPSVTFFGPIAIATDNASTNWQIYVLDNVSNRSSSAKALYQISSTDFTTATVLAKVSDLTGSTTTPFTPIAMAFTNGHLLILDRGALSDVAAAPRIFDVQVSPSLQINPPHKLTTVVEPLSMTILPNGNLLIGDARLQNTAQSANIVQVNRSTDNWIETDVVSTNQNPLIAPVGVIRRDDTHLYALDLGLKPFLSTSSTQFLRIMAEAAVVYSIDLQQQQVTRATELGALAHPTGMIQDALGTLYIADQGEQSTRVWRATPNEFGVVVHFSSQRPTTQQDRRQIQQNISDIVDQEKPAHTNWTMFNTTL